MTQHRKDSYEIQKRWVGYEEQYVLLIKDPELFWIESKYLGLLTNDPLDSWLTKEFRYKVSIRPEQKLK